MKMDENTGWTVFGCVLIICVTIICVSFQLYYRDKNNKIVEMTNNGSDPVAASLALDNIYDTNAKSYFLSQQNKQGELNDRYSRIR